MNRAIPTSTYRYQISPQFTLLDAAADLPRLVELGIGAVYLSPVLTATLGSDHGYDWVDCTHVDPQRGGEEGWSVFCHAARAHGLQVVLDLVPNHCGIAHAWENPAWWSVLAQGQSSPFAAWFDVDWQTGPIVVPVLPEDGSDHGLVLNDDRTELIFFEHRFPVAEGTADDGASAHVVAERQHYRLAPYPDDATELNYRRFFAVSSLAGLRIEDEQVFEATHARIFRMVDQGQVQGLRIDHPDGLTEPGQYLRRLRERVGEKIWIVVEKIQSDGEPLPPDWPVQGTTGYDAMAEVTRLLVDPASKDVLTRGYAALTGDQRDVHEHVLVAKREIAHRLFGSERARIQRVLPPDLHGPLADEALVELAAHMDVYRTYLPQDKRALDRALTRALAARPDLGATLNNLVGVLGDVDQEAGRRFQQLTGALMAKGLEDTAWYRYTRWIGANEVGGHPHRLGTTVAEFHTDQQRRQRRAPHSMVSLSTHDTKRGEDVRAALAALTEVPGQALAWGRTFQDATGLPDRPFAWLLAQTLVATGTIDAPRLHAYATKAMREANTLTGWGQPDEGYEQLVHDALDRAISDHSLTEPLVALRELIAPGVISNVLAQKLVALTMPGVPDIYRGTEIIEDSLVDPDNRRPIDMARLVAARADQTPAIDDLDKAKLWVVGQALRLRRDHPERFSTYCPLVADGPLAEHLVAFDRGGVTTLATRMPLGLAAAGGWGEATIALSRRHDDVLTGRRFAGTTTVAALLSQLPVALLRRV